jgi:1-deoxy-D-xylulose-5-phosphate reductoisomerase
VKQSLVVLGSTGSIGRSTLEVARRHPERIRVVALAARGGSAERLLEQAREFKPELVVVVEPVAGDWLAERLPVGTRLAVGRDALLEAAAWPDAERVLAAMVGAAGLPAVATALDHGKTVALANKEALVVGGRLLPELAHRRGGAILPVDSEHAALHQALRCGTPREVARLTLTASGGPFRLWPRERWRDVRPEDALKHPTWAMGAKITVDSATLMNKALEFIEARFLFEVPAERIDVVVHPRSIVHSLVEFVDGSVIAQLSPNDMMFPIQYALAHPDRWENDFPRLDLSALGSLEFEPVDETRFIAIRLARQALAAGESAPAVLNAANEVAVAAFLAGELAFPAITDLVEATLGQHRAESVDSLERALSWDHWGRERARELLHAGMVR